MAFRLTSSHFLKLTWVILVSLYSFSFIRELNSVATNQSTCVCAYDGFGYYMYLPFFLTHGSLKMTPEWAQKKQDDYCNGIVAYQLIQRENGNYVDVYQMGQSFVEAPAFFIGHLGAVLFHFPTDGFSKPYHLAFVCNAWLFVLLGIFYVTKLLRLFLDEKLTAISLLVLFLGSNYWVTATLSYSLQHIYLFALIAAMGYYLFAAIRTEKLKKSYLIVAAILFGLCTVIRPTHAMLFLLPVLLLWNYFPTRKAFWWKISWFPIVAFCWNIPQLLYWKFVGGSWVILNLHTEELILSDPNVLHFLFSFRKGWFIYSPIFFLLVPGFFILSRINKRLFYALLSLTVSSIWVFSSWENWWYAASYGSRVMVDFYPLLILPLAFGIQYFLQKRFTKAMVSIFIIWCCVLALFQSWQFKEGILHNERMTGEQYWYIFGKTNKANFDDHRLLIDRADLNWVDEVHRKHWKDQSIEKRSWYHLTQAFRANGLTDTLIVKLPFYPTLKTDEVQVRVKIQFECTDTLHPGSIHFEAAGKHNCYAWNSFELSPSNAQKYANQPFVFNLPDIRHRTDYLQVYVKNPSEQAIRIRQLSIETYSLIRK
jgi:hypothetical protein